MAKSGAEVQFAQLAVQNYVAGRYAAIVQMIPVLGNLLHHAAEMSLKAALASHKSLQELRQLGHNLPKIWALFKVHYPSAGAGRFDEVISGLHRFEELRYPDSVLSKGAMMELVVFREHAGTASGTSAVPRYPLLLEEIDELQTFVFHTADIDPRFFTGSMSAEGKRYLYLHNRSVASW